MEARERPLAGVGVLVTRPARRADGLARLIEADGGVAIRFPTVEIADPTDRAAALRVIDSLSTVDIAIFISPNAVEKAIELIAARTMVLPPAMTIAAVGQGTARELTRFGITHPITPPQFNSEALLAMPALAHVAGKRIVIFRGEGGRELLGETLSARGARVEYAECYRRVRPTADPTALLQRWARGEIDIVSITSATGLSNLDRMLGAAGRPRLTKTPVVVVSAAQAAMWRELGATQTPIVTLEPSDKAILEAIRTWRAQQISL